MNAQSAWAAFVGFCAKVQHWCLWFGKLVIAIGVAYAEATQLIYLAGCVYLVSR